MYVRVSRARTQLICFKRDEQYLEFGTANNSFGIFFPAGSSTERAVSHSHFVTHRRQKESGQGEAQARRAAV